MTVSCQIIWHLIYSILWVSRFFSYNQLHWHLYTYLVLILTKKSCRKSKYYYQQLNIWPNNWRLHNWQSRRTWLMKVKWKENSSLDWFLSKHQNSTTEVKLTTNIFRIKKNYSPFVMQRTKECETIVSAYKNNLQGQLN